MGVSKLRTFQIKDQSITREKLALDFLNGSNLDITNGNANATFTGLAQGVNPTDAVNVAQLNAAISGFTGGVNLRGGLGGAADLTADSTGNAYADGAPGYQIGDKFYITSDGSLTVSDGTLAVNQGDVLVINKDIADDANIVLADLIKIDNTESADILREADVIDNFLSTSAIAPLSANKGKELNDRLSLIEATGQEVCNETPAVVAASSTVTIANTPKAGSLKVYRNGQRLCEGVLPNADYSVTGTTITFDEQFAADETVQLDYRF